MFLLLAAVSAVAGPSDPGYFIRGIVRDSVSDEPLPYASVYITGRSNGTLTDSKGIFELTVPDTTSSLTVMCQGYGRKIVPVRKNRVNVYAVRLSPRADMLGEVVVTRRRYSKKNNPAVDLMEKIRAMRKANDPELKPHYGYDKYLRTTLGLNNFDKDSQSNALFRRFPFLWEHVDTSEISGKPILNLSVKETSSRVHYRNPGHDRREVVTGLKSSGIDEIADQENMRVFLEDVLREIDLYDKDINLLQNRFVSPLSPLAADFYKFYITDTVSIDGERAIQLSFYPHNKSAFGFVGQMYVIPDSSAMFIRRVTMRVPSEINLNFIENMYVDQEFARAPDGSRLKTKDDMTLEISVIPGMQGMYVRRNVAYANHSFDAPPDEDRIFAAMAAQTVEKDASRRDEVFWQGVRLFEIPENEKNIDRLLTRLRSVPLYYWGERIIKWLVSGYVATGPDSRFDVGPLNTFISGNSLEGLRLRLGGMTTANLSPRWFTRFYGAYGFRDHKWKYGFELEYSFRDKRYHSREFPVHSLRLNSTYDVDQIGQNYMFTNKDNFVLALKRQKDDRVTYRLLNRLTYTLELENNFSVTSSVSAERQYASRLLEFRLSEPGSPLGDMPLLPRFDENYLDVELRYAPGEKFYQTKTYRIPINMDAPVITLRHRFAPENAFHNRWGVNRTELSVTKRFWFSAWGYIDIMAKGGHVWSRHTPYTQMFIPNANLSYTVQPESFSLMNAMEFVTDSYVQTDLTYWANGAILNYIPLLKKAKLREVFSFRSFWGRLSAANDPRLNSGMLAFPGFGGIAVTDVSRTPYMEAGVGIDNIFKCLRLDYVWRLTHRWPGYPVDRSGLRVAFHVTF